MNRTKRVIRTATTQRQGPGQWRARITYARSLGDTPSQLAGSTAKQSSAWVELGTGF
jgi:hypothetical protein